MCGPWRQPRRVSYDLDRVPNGAPQCLSMLGRGGANALSRDFLLFLPHYGEVKNGQCLLLCIYSLDLQCAKEYSCAMYIHPRCPGITNCEVIRPVEKDLLFFQPDPKSKIRFCQYLLFPPFCILCPLTHFLFFPFFISTL